MIDPYKSVVECELMPALDTLCHLAQSGNVQDGQIANLLDLLRLGMRARLREVEAAGD